MPVVLPQVHFEVSVAASLHSPHSGSLPTSLLALAREQGVEQLELSLTKGRWVNGAVLDYFYCIIDGTAHLSFQSKWHALSNPKNPLLLLPPRHRHGRSSSMPQPLGALSPLDWS